MVKRIKPVSRRERIEAEINKIVDEVFFNKKEFFGLDEGWIPYIDILENSNEIKVEIELPGVTQKDISLLLQSNRLDVKGVKRENLSRGKVKYLRLEREYGIFRRLIFLPQAVIPEKAKAAIENGVLTISLTKRKRKKEKGVIVKIQKPEPKE